MGAAERIDIHGAKGGDSSPKQPTEAADSLRSTNLAKILIAVGEGEFEGTPTAADIYLDNTPINDASGNVNFPNVKWEWRPGSIDQSYVPGTPSVENETTVNVELRSDTPYVRSITNIQLSAVRVRLAWPALQSQDSEGNVGGYRIEYVIEVATDGGSYQQVLSEAVDGKTTTRYERSRRIDLPAATSGWQIRVRRTTPNQNTNRIADTMLVAGMTEVIDAKLRYPNTALLYIEFDAEQFTNIPAVTVKTKARKWLVPSNYDPVSRSYSGVWDGTFKQAWTNNPAWATFGVCTEDRLGLGKRIKSWMVDKWELYRIAQYCDQNVDNGLGGVEPRFLCDLNLQGKTDAWSLLRDISAIYRGMTYWAQGQLVMQADMPRAQDFDYVFTRANVIGGTFKYGSASAKTRYTRALVSYDNPANNYDTDVIAYADIALQRRLGDKPTELSAIGCTRASEAQRRAKWVVLSNSLDRTVTFTTGMEGRIPLPGYIIPIADSLLAGREIGGRISAATARVVTLDRDTQAKAGDRLIINLPSGKAEARTVASVSGRAITVTTDYSEPPIAQLQWALDADDLAIPLYRVLKVRRTTEGDYEISALQYEPSKFAAIDSGARLEDRPISVIPITVVPPPASVTLTARSAIDQGIAVNTMTIEWPAVSGAVGYDVEWRKDNGNWIKVQRTGSTSVDVAGIYAGGYLARVRSVSSFDIASVWRTSILTQLTGKVGVPPAVTSLTTESQIFGIGLAWTFPEGAADTQRTEIWYGPNNQLENATKLADLAYPQSDYALQSLLAGATLFFWARLVDRTGNIGPFYPTGTGVVGQASSDAGPILDLIVGQIGESELGQGLKDRIDLIDGPPSMPGSVADRLNQLGTQVTQVTDQLQDQIDAIGDLADSAAWKDDKAYTSGQSVIFTDGYLYLATQNVPVNTPPPNTTYWLNVGQAVQTANGLAARVSTTETKITSLEGTTTSQASQITGLQTSLTTTNGNVATAQAAANAANTLAGGKGKVIVQSAAPAAADQLAQNLWIDTTGNANTPKRWTGSAWAAVTDKAATDAAAAAASALAQVATKAEASAVNSLTTRVTNAENTVTSQGTAITGLNNSLTATNTNVTAAQTAANNAATLAGSKGKVMVQTATPAAADQLAQNLWIDITGGANTPKRWNGAAWAPVSDKVATDAATAAANALAQVATKAEASTVTALSNTVTQQGTTITAQGNALTSVQISLGGIAPENYMDDPTFAGGRAGLQGLTVAVVDRLAADAPANAPAARLGKVTYPTTATNQYLSVAPLPQYRANFTGLSVHAIAVNPGDVFTLSFQFWGDNTAARNIQAYVQYYGMNSNTEISAFSGANRAVDSTWKEYTTVTFTVPADVYGMLVRVRARAGDEMNVYVANVRLEKQSATQAATASAISGLDGRVSTQEGVTTAQGTAITQVQATLNGIGGSGVNLVPADYSVYGVTPPQMGLSTGSLVRSSAADALALKGYALKLDWTVASATINAVFAKSDNLAGANIAFKPQKYLVSYRAKASVAGHVMAMYLRGFTSAGAAVNSSGAVQQALTTDWVRYSALIDASTAAMAGLSQMLLAIQPNRSGVANRTVWIDQVMLEAQVGNSLEPSAFVVGDSFDQVALKADVSLVTALDGRVTSAEGALTAQGTALTQVQSTLGGIGGAGTNLLADDYSWITSLTLPPMALSSTAVAGAAVPDAPSSFGIKMTSSSTASGAWAMMAPTNNAAGWNIPVEPGTYLVSFYASAPAAANVRVRLYSAGFSAYSQGQAVTTTRTRYTHQVVVTASSVVALLFYYNMLAVAGTEVTVDSVMIEKQIGTGTEASPFTAGNSARAIAAQATSISSIDTRVTQTEAGLSAVATRTDGVYAQLNPSYAGATDTLAGATDTLVGVFTTMSAIADGDMVQGLRTDEIQVQLNDATAAIQVAQEVAISTANKVELSYSVKLQANANGTTAFTGWTIGLDNSSGAFESTFMIAVNRFILATTDEGDYADSPFAVIGTQAFLKEAFIQKATIQNLLVGMRLTSVAVNSSGQPYIDMDFNSGSFALRGAGSKGRSEFVPGSILMYDTNNTLRIKQSVN
jgi:predicted phage tail protein